MLSPEEWWGILEAYGAKVWPAQAVFFAAVVLLVLLVLLKPGRIANTLMKLTTVRLISEQFQLVV